jgi:hypothetical protein
LTRKVSGAFVRFFVRRFNRYATVSVAQTAPLKIGYTSVSMCCFTPESKQIESQLAD